MDDTHCKQTIVYPDGREFVDEHYPVHYLHIDNSAALSGFKKGTLKKMTCELQNGYTIILEATGEKA